MKQTVLIILLLVAAVSGQAAESDRFIVRLELPTGQTAVIAEGDFEARSLGSFCVRLYDAASAGDETTFFSCGLVMARDGSIEEVVLTDIDGGKNPEIVVVVRSAGSGGYLSAHALAFEGGKLVFIASVQGLPADGDYRQALQLAAKNSLKENK